MAQPRGSHALHRLDCPTPGHIVYIGLIVLHQNDLNHYLPLNKTGAHSIVEIPGHYGTLVLALAQ